MHARECGIIEEWQNAIAIHGVMEHEGIAKTKRNTFIPGTVEKRGALLLNVPGRGDPLSASHQ